MFRPSTCGVPTTIFETSETVPGSLLHDRIMSLGSPLAGSNQALTHLRHVNLEERRVGAKGISGCLSDINTELSSPLVRSVT